MEAYKKRLLNELNSLLDKYVSVKTINGEEYLGRLVGFDLDTLTVCLADSTTKNGQKHPRLVIHGNVIHTIRAEEEPFQMKALAERLEKVFPGMVKYYEEANLITVADSVKVTEKGVEGRGLIAEKAKKVFEQFMLERKQKSS